MRLFRKVGRYALAVVIACATLGSAQGQTVARQAAIAPNDKQLPVRVVGRVQMETTAKATVYRHQWPGVYFETRFRGDHVALTFDDPANEYRATVDGLAPVAIAQPGQGAILIGDLGPGAHQVRLEKVTESIDHVGVFGGFYAPQGDGPAVAPGRRIEFIGDSGMTGYGIRSTTRQCTQDEVRLTSDTQQAYPALVAKRMGADYQVNAISGRGMVRNYDGVAPDYAMSDTYPFTFFDKTVPYAGKGWAPQIVVVALGGNDFYKDVKPGEKWPSQQKLAEDYFVTYGRFVADLHKRYPAATILIQWPGSEYLPDAETRQMFRIGRESIEGAARRVGLTWLEFVSPPKFELESAACDYHGSLADHRKIANWLTVWLEARPDLWSTRLKR